MILFNKYGLRTEKIPEKIKKLEGSLRETYAWAEQQDINTGEMYMYINMMMNDIILERQCSKAKKQLENEQRTNS